MVTITCKYCEQTVTSERKRRKFCSNRCMAKWHNGSDRERACKECRKIFQIVSRSDANRRYCSQKCAKRAYTKQQSTWHFEHQDKMREYSHTYSRRNPEAWANRRLKTIAFLGGACIVCGATNPNWLHIDFKPTTRGSQFRHPRHFAYISQHVDQFRLLCANHHYELTLTGYIEGTDITQ